MRIAHIITFVSADGAFGGPVAVAVAQAEAQAKRGHRVTFIAGWDGLANIEIPGVQVKLFRSRHLLGKSLSSLFSPRLLWFLVRKKADFDVVHIHLGRDATTLPSAFLLKTMRRRYVGQTHGMIMPDDRIGARLLDSVVTGRVITAAAARLVLTDSEQSGLESLFGRSIPFTRIGNGVPLGPGNHQGERDRSNVLFLARLAERKRPLAFAHMADMLSGEYPTASFSVVGPDEGELHGLQAFRENAKSKERLTYEGALSGPDAINRMARAGVYVLPSVGEVFPMSVLEAMSVGTPVVLTEDCGLAPLLDQHGAAIVTGTAIDEIAAGVGRLLSDNELWAETQRNASSLIASTLSIERVVDSLESVYWADSEQGETLDKRHSEHRILGD